MRNPEHAAALTALGAADIAVGHFADSIALRFAAAGVQAIYHICPNMSRDEVVYARAVAAAAKARGVKRFVYHSVLHPQIEAMPHHWAKMHTEEMLFASGFDLTILQPTAYMQNILGAWQGITTDGVFRVPYPVETQLCLVDLDDIAAAAAVVLTKWSRRRDPDELVGTGPLSQLEVASAIGAALKRDVRAEAESLAAWESRAGPPAWASMSAKPSPRCSAITPFTALWGIQTRCVGCLVARRTIWRAFSVAFPRQANLTRDIA